MKRTCLLVALGAVLSLMGASCSSVEPGQETSAADAPERLPTTTAPPPPTLERVALAPSLVDGSQEGGPIEGRMVAVAAGRFVGRVAGSGERLVAVGSSSGVAALWWSDDGQRWERAAVPPSLFADATLADVAADPVVGGFVVVGGVGGSGAAWASPDGQSWTRSEVDAGPALEVVGGASFGLIALGTGAPSGPAASLGADAEEQTVAWLSLSGDRWVRALDDPEVFSRAGVEKVVDVVAVGGEAQALVERQGAGVERWRTTDGLFWSVLPSAEGGALPGLGSASASRAIALGSAVVAVGIDAKADGTDAALWLSSGLGPFEPAEHDESELGGDGTQAMTAVAAAEDRLLVVGTETDGDGDVDAVIWSSGDGIGVTRSGEIEPPEPGDQFVADLAVLANTAVAVGREETDDGSRAMVWVVRNEAAPEAPATGEGEGDAPAPPELAWLRVADQEAVLAGSGERRMEAVASLPDFFLAAGSVTDADGTADGALWRSVDGTQWSALASDRFGGPGDQRLSDLAIGPSGLVAVGFDGSSAAAWTSPDGSSWTQVPPDEAVFGGAGDQRMVAVAARSGGQGWVAVGDDGAGGPALWVSDGGAWRREAPPGLGEGTAVELSDVVAGPGTTVVGRAGDAARAWVSPDGVTWSASDLGPGRVSAVAAAEAGLLVAVGNGPGDGADAVTWRSTDALSWERSEGGELAGPLNQGAAGVDAGGSVVVAVGTTDLGGGGDASAWTSSDAATWGRSLHDEMVLGGDQDQAMLDVTSRSGRVVAVGWSGSSPDQRVAAVWTADLAGGSARSRL